MRKFCIFFLGLFACTITMQAQIKVAVFDPIGNLPDGIKLSMREIISAAVPYSGYYKAVERPLIEKVMEENQFQASGLVDESQIAELGRKVGADLICLTIGEKLGNDYYYLSCKLIDYTTSQIIRQMTVQTCANSKSAEAAANDLAIRIFERKATISAQNVQSKIAIFEPDGNVSDNIKTIVREEIGQVIANNPSYAVLERTNIERILEENKFQGNYSDESQVREMGKLLGANYVCVITIARSGNEYNIFCKLVDVKTGFVQGNTGGSKAYSSNTIACAAKLAAMNFSANSVVLKKEIEQWEKIIKLCTEPPDRINKNNYFSLGVGNGVTYGSFFGTGLAGRNGGVFGVGYEAGIGFGVYEDLKSYSHWSAGLRIYPYKFIYLSANYGVIGTELLESSNTNDGRWTMGGSKLQQGTSFLGGASINLFSKWFPCTLTLAAGLSYPGFFDFSQKSMFAWNVAWSFVLF